MVIVFALGTFGMNFQIYNATMATEVFGKGAQEYGLLGTIMAVGLTVSVFQAVTQIHEATLAFVPKMVAALAVFAIAGPWMLTTLVDYLRRTLESLPMALG